MQHCQDQHLFVDNRVSHDEWRAGDDQLPSAFDPTLTSQPRKLLETINRSEDAFYLRARRRRTGGVYKVIRREQVMRCSLCQTDFHSPSRFIQPALTLS